LRHHGDVMLLADRGFANHDLISWLQASGWHYSLRLPSDVLRRNPVTIRHILFEMSVTRRNSLCSVRMCRIVME
jgi:hypothetical protein